MRMIMRLLTGLAVSVPLLVQAQAYPNRPIRVIVPQPPGGGFDLVARTLAEPLSRVMGTPVVVENRPGAGMLVGTEAVAKSEADGYTHPPRRETQHRLQRRTVRKAAVRSARGLRAGGARHLE